MVKTKERRIPKRWTEEEDWILQEETKKQEANGDAKDWHRIASKLPGRTNKDCRKRWVNKVCGGLKKGAWSKHEDACLIKAVETHGQRWTLIANEVGFRSPDQCAKRWQLNLDPCLEHRKWTEDEDELLMRLVEQHGREWKLFQNQGFSGRSTNEIKNRYSSLSRKAGAAYTRASVSVVSEDSSDGRYDSESENGEDGEDALLELQGSTSKSASAGLVDTAGDIAAEACITARPNSMDPLNMEGTRTHEGLTVWADHTFDPSCTSYNVAAVEIGDLMEISPDDKLLMQHKTTSAIASLAGTGRQGYDSAMSSVAGWQDLSCINESVTCWPPNLPILSPHDMSGPLGNMLVDTSLHSIHNSRRDSRRDSKDDNSIRNVVMAAAGFDRNFRKVTLTIDECSRETLETLLNLAEIKDGKSKLEIN